MRWTLLRARIVVAIDTLDQKGCWSRRIARCVERNYSYVCNELRDIEDAGVIKGLSLDDSSRKFYDVIDESSVKEAKAFIEKETKIGFGGK